MRLRFALVVVGCALLSACLTSPPRRTPGTLGGSVADFDRGTGAMDLPQTGGPAGAPSTVGIASTNGSENTVPPPSALAITEPAPPPLPPPSAAPERRRDLVAGPVQPGPKAPETVRRLQQTLRERGYYQGPDNGIADEQLTRALERFQADRALPITGRLDAETAKALGLPPPPAPPPPGAG